MSKKIFILDTNVILSDPKAIFKFEDNDIVLPLVVIEEVDKFKKEMNQIGLAARNFGRYIDSLRRRGSLMKGVELQEGGTLRIELNVPENLPKYLTHSYADNLILAVALELSQKTKDREVVLVSKDINVRIKADAMGIKADTFRSETVNYAKLPKGFEDAEVDGKIIDEIFNNKQMPLKDFEEQTKLETFPNKFFNLTDVASDQHRGVVRVDPFNQTVVPMKFFKNVWGLNARNLGQKMALDLLLDDRIKLVSLVGIAGTGKTLLSIASGLQKTLDGGVYSKMLVARPIYPMGKDIGYLPGSVQEKLKPWMQPVFDNLEYLLDGYQSENFGRMSDLMHSGMLEVEALTYIRGRSIPDQFIIVDEAQNLTPHEIKTIVSRVGENTKIILTGDPFQIDNPYMNESNNGLSYIVDKFQSVGLAGHIILEKGERSALANIAAEML